MKNKFKVILTTSVGLLLVAFFQNCQKQKYQGPEDELSKVKSYNGGPYEGKPRLYTRFDSANPCTQLGANGKPLPNKQIFAYGTTTVAKAQLTRDNCTDFITPTEMDPSLVTFADLTGNSINVSGQVLSELKTPGDFDVVASQCPTGYSTKTVPTRTNLMVSGLLLDDPSAWYMLGLAVVLDGVLDSLPRYHVYRNDANYLDYWNRLSQAIDLTQGHVYVYTFLAEKESVGVAGFSLFYDNYFKFSVNFDLATGAVTDGDPNFIIETTSKVVSNGRLVSIYFNVPVNAPRSAVGVYPGSSYSPQAVGNGIYLTAMQLEDVGNFCTKP